MGNKKEPYDATAGMHVKQMAFTVVLREKRCDTQVKMYCLNRFPKKLLKIGECQYTREELRGILHSEIIDLHDRLSFEENF